MNFIGLDAHSKTCSLVCLDQNDLVTRKAHLETSESKLLGFVRAITGPKKLIFEESGLSQWLFMLLKNHVDELVVCNAMYLSRNPKSKTDFNDALHLARELKCGHFVNVHHEDSELMRLRSLISGYQDTVDATTRAKNQFKAILRKEAINTKSMTVYGEPEILEKLSNPSDRFVGHGLQQVIATLSNVNATYQERFMESAKKNEVIKNLMSVPGVAYVRAHIIASVICSADRFPNKYKLWSYAMLVRHQEQSGGVVLSNRSKYARSDLKAVFMAAALTVTMGNSGLTKYYEHLLLKGLDKKKARKALARKIAAICLSIMKSGRKYHDETIVQSFARKDAL